jgi:hypothetical protein
MSWHEKSGYLLFLYGTRTELKTGDWEKQENMRKEYSCQYTLM